MVPVSAVRGRGSTAAGAASGNWWEVAGQTCVAAYQPKGAADIAASYVNLANPGTNDATVSVAPLFATATGWQFRNLVSGGGYLIFPAITDNSSVFIRLMAATGGADRMLWTDNQAWLIEEISTNVQYVWKGGSVARGAPFAEASVLGMAAGQPYKNGSTAGAAITGSTSTSGALNLGNTSWHIACTVAALAIYSTTLSASDVAALTTAMNAL